MEEPSPPPATPSPEAVAEADVRPDSSLAPARVRPPDFEERPELEEAYMRCEQEVGQVAKDCAYHLWQTELMTLRPGSESTAGALDSVRRVFFAHREAATARNPQFEERFWAWFWGAWWKEQPRSSWGDPEGCLAFPGKPEQEECLRYSERAWNWLEGRKIQALP